MGLKIPESAVENPSCHFDTELPMPCTHILFIAHTAMYSHITYIVHVQYIIMTADCKCSSWPKHFLNYVRSSLSQVPCTLNNVSYSQERPCRDALSRRQSFNVKGHTHTVHECSHHNMYGSHVFIMHE